MPRKPRFNLIGIPQHVGCSYYKDKIEEMTAQQIRLGIPGRPGVDDEVAVCKTGY